MKLSLLSAVIWIVAAGAIAAQGVGPELSVSGEGEVAVAPIWP